MFDIVFVYLRVIVLVIMSEWISRLCTFVHVCARITRGTYLQSQGEFSQFGGILSIWFGMDQMCYNLVSVEMCGSVRPTTNRAAQSYQ